MSGYFSFLFICCRRLNWFLYRIFIYWPGITLGVLTLLYLVLTVTGENTESLIVGMAEQARSYRNAPAGSVLVRECDRDGIKRVSPLPPSDVGIDCPQRSITFAGAVRKYSRIWIRDWLSLVYMGVFTELILMILKPRRASRMVCRIQFSDGGRLYNQTVAGAGADDMEKGHEKGVNRL